MMNEKAPINTKMVQTTSLELLQTQTFPLLITLLNRTVQRICRRLRMKKYLVRNKPRYGLLVVINGHPESIVVSSVLLGFVIERTITLHLTL